LGGNTAHGQGSQDIPPGQGCGRLQGPVKEFGNRLLSSDAPSVFLHHLNVTDHRFREFVSPAGQFPVTSKPLHEWTARRIRNAPPLGTNHWPGSWGNSRTCSPGDSNGKRQAATLGGGNPSQIRLRYSFALTLDFPTFGGLGEASLGRPPNAAWGQSQNIDGFFAMYGKPW